MRKLILAAALFTGFFSLSKAEESALVHKPSLNQQGDKIAFCFQGDIWVKDLNAQTVSRLTVNKAYDGSPVWSKDGKQIAFTSNRYGNNDIFVVPATGGTPERVTFHSANDALSDWTADGRLLFTSARINNDTDWLPEVLSISANGGTPKTVMSSLGLNPVLSPDGTRLAFVRGAVRISREDYDGPAQKDVWVYHFDSDTYTRLTEFNGNDFNPLWLNNEDLVFISSRNGHYNVHKMKVGAKGEKLSEPERLTDFKEGIRYMAVGANGSKISLEIEDKVYLFDIASKQAQEQNMILATDYRFMPYEYKTHSSGVSDYAISPNGKYMAFIVRGELFIKENGKDKKRSVNVTRHPWRDRDPLWVNDSTILFSSDREGNYNFYIARSADKDESNLMKCLNFEVKQITDTDEDEMNPIIYRKDNRLAYQLGRTKYYVAEWKNNKISGAKLLVNNWDAPGSVSFSPDGKWLSYAMENLDNNSDVYIQKVDGSTEPINVSMHPRMDSDPVWSPDGSKLGFISIRNNGDSDVWFAWLKKSDYEKSKAEWDEETSEEKGKKKEKKDVKVQIDVDGIYDRVEQVTAMPGNETNIAISKDGKTFYFVTNANFRQKYKAKRDLYSIKWDGSKLKQLTKAGQAIYGLSFDSKYSYLYYVKSRGRLARLNAKSGKSESLPFTAKQKIDFRGEKEQIFEEAWRGINNGFYDPNFHGKDWDEMKKKYKPWCMKASTDADFYNIFNFMLGEINASHMGLRGPRRESASLRERTGKIGIDIEPLSKGVKVKRVVEGTQADREISKLYPGDVILEVNGEEVKAERNFYELMLQTANDKTILKVKGKDKKERMVVIRPERSIGSAVYKEWIKERRALVDKYSNGRLGYIHIEGMNWPSFERFERDLMAAGHGKEGLVIDVRNNGGGWTTDYLMAVLNVKQHSYVVPRGAAKNLEAEKTKFRAHYAFGARLPLSSWVKPSIALCNENSYSNAEIFSHAYKANRIGKLVGKPTFGAVISTGAIGLIDGSYVRLPYRGWFVKESDMNMENGPAVPHFVLENTPDAKAKGEDQQLKKAVEELLKDLK